MPFQAILREADQLQKVSTRLEALADRHPLMSEPLTTIALSVRNTATLLAVLVAAKGPNRSEYSKKTGVSGVVALHRAKMAAKKLP
jgi:hypothetical protein